jgi:hypothetical protein
MEFRFLLVYIRWSLRNTELAQHPTPNTLAVPLPCARDDLMKIENIAAFSRLFPHPLKSIRRTVRTLHTLGSCNFCA